MTLSTSRVAALRRSLHDSTQARYYLETHGEFMGCSIRDCSICAKIVAGNQELFDLYNGSNPNEYDRYDIG